jgi:hypothetical protein
MAVDKEPLIPSHQGDDDGPEKQEDYKRGRLLDEEQLMNIVNEAKVSARWRGGLPRGELGYDNSPTIPLHALIALYPNRPTIRSP